MLRRMVGYGESEQARLAAEHMHHLILHRPARAIRGRLPLLLCACCAQRYNGLPYPLHIRHGFLVTHDFFLLNTLSVTVRHVLRRYRCAFPQIVGRRRVTWRARCCTTWALPASISIKSFRSAAVSCPNGVCKARCTNVSQSVQPPAASLLERTVPPA